MLQLAIRKAVADSGSYEPSGPASWGRPLLLVGVNHLLDTETSPSLETERFIDYGFHASTCLALQQHQIKSRQDRGTTKCPASSVFNSSALHGEVDSSVVGCCFFFFSRPIFEKPLSQLLQENVTMPLVQARGNLISL